jgi:amino acid transporter
MISAFGNVSTQIMVKARSWQAMARDGLFFNGLGDLHEKYKAPNNALVAQAVWASVILLTLLFVYIFFNIKSDTSYETIIAFFSATGAIFNIMTIYSLFIFRKRYPDVRRPYRAWLYPFSIILVLILMILYLVMTLVTAFLPSLLGLALTSSGLIYYLWKKKS